MNLKVKMNNEQEKPVHIELGCGHNRRDMEGYTNIGVDIEEGPVTDHVCNLGFENLPFQDSYADVIQAYDVLEHIPKCAWFERTDGTVARRVPLIHLMNEIYRVLKPSGLFYMESPYGEWGFRRDPTHVSKFSDDWYHYFQPHDNLYADQGLVTCNFKVEKCYLKPYKHIDDIICTHLRAIK